LNALAPDVALGLLDRVAAELGAEADPPAWLLATLAATVERLPSSIEAMGDGLALHCDALVAVGAEGIYVSGWVHAGENLLASVTCHGEFQSQRIDDTWVRSPRKDVIEFLASRGIHSTQHEPGFVAFVALPASSTCRLVVTTPTGTSRAMRLPRTAPTTAMASIRAVLTSFNVKHPSLRRLLDAQVGPAVETAWAHRAKPPRRVTVQRFGPAVPKPSVSVIVPLYGRCDFADYQMALFADDSDFQALELIYFVDDPTLYDEFRPQCDDLFATYQVPFTLATAGANFGFAGANNCAAGIACGQRFLLMNSDVFPMRPGWVSQMLAIYAKLDQPGCLGTKLLYEDGSVQHAGMAFRRHAPWGELWLNDHPHKGQSAKGLTGLQPAAAVTAACVMVDAALYRELGGLSEDYIIGDFEDSDFCLRAAAAGRRHWVALDIELYHLERQSQNRIGDSNWRTNVTLYNGWLHTQRWGAALEKLAR
jgi:GT2 family glycosyltransferase